MHYPFFVYLKTLLKYFLQYDKFSVGRFFCRKEGKC